MAGSVLHDCIMQAYKEVIEDNIFNEHPLMTAVNRKAEEMSTRDLIAKAREEATKEKIANAIEALTADLVGAEPHVDGDIMAIKVRFPDNTRIYNYAIVRGGDKWHFTARGGDGYTTEGLIDELVYLLVKSADMVWAWSDTIGLELD